MKILFLLTSGLLCFSLYSQEKLSAPLSSSQVIENYSEAIEQEDNEAALEALNKVLVGDTSYALIQAQRSQMLITLERYEEAIDVCKEGLNIPRSTFNQVFRLNHGIALGALEKYDEAMKVYKELKRDMPFYPSVWNNIAALHLSKKEYDKAHVAYQEMARMFPFDGVSHFNLGIFAYNEGHFTEAFMAFNMVILLEPYTQRAHSVLVLLNEIANNSKAEKTPKDGFEIASDEYQEIDLLIKNYVALSKKYKVPGKNQLFMAKQNHLIFSQLNEKESTG
jgi:tetratricopeptide (TPR) repeat protein